MRSRPNRFIRFLPSLALMALPGCHARPAEKVGASSATLRYAMGMEPTTLDPPANSSAATGELLQNIFEGLVTLDTDFHIAPCLADRWDISADGKTYTFHLNTQAKFQTPFARPVTADDVKYSFERSLWPETKAPYASVSLEPIVGTREVVSGKRRDLQGVKVIDPHTLTITLQYPAGYFLVELTGIYVVCREAIDRNGGRLDAKAAIGTGPFLLQEYRPGVDLVLTANPGYYRGAPRLKRIERPIVLNPGTVRQKYLADELDLCSEAASDYANDAPDASLRAQTKLLPFSRVDFMVMHQSLLPAFRDRLVRQAFAHAIDRDEIARVAYFGVARRADGFLPPGVLGYNPDLRKLACDPALARQLLAQAGYPNGRGFPELKLVFQQESPAFAAMAQIIRKDLQGALGITVQLEEREAGVFFTDTDNDKIAFYLVGWMAVDPYDFLSTLLRSGRKGGSGYHSAPFDALCALGDHATDPGQRAAYYRQADQLQADDVAVFPIAYPSVPYLFKPYVHNCETNLGGLMPHYHTSIGR